jgi:redox-sensitive bicupin YhaK (pirin superfamily)
MKTILHKANTRGHANHGWLDSKHTFSFANYHNPERMHFGMMRVLNDDIVAPGMGFGKHPHDNMEIISLPLSGDLKHGDNMGNSEIIREGDIQVMSAGTGIVHSEFNPNQDKEVNFLQIWIFPKEKNVAPRYDQLSIREVATKNSFYQILSPNKEDQGVWIHQDAWMHMANFESNKKAEYELKKDGNGVYIFVLEGDIRVGEQTLTNRDGYGIWETDAFSLETLSESKVLVIEVPMN